MTSRPARDPRTLVSGWRRRVRLALLRRRRLLAALLTALAAGTALLTLRPPPPATVPVTVAARDLGAGEVVGADDLVVRPFAAGTAPSSGVGAGAAAGRVLAAPVAAGEPLTDVRLVGEGLLPDDDLRLAVPVRLPDAAMVALLDVGDEVDLLATDPQGGGTELVAADVAVLAVPAAAEQTNLPGRLVVVAVEPAEVAQVTGASVGAVMTYAWGSR